MKIILGTFLLLATACATGAASRNDDGMTAPSHLGRVRHVVLFKFKDGTPPEKIREIETAFAGLRQQIPQIRDYEWGTDMSPEGLQQGHTHAFLVTFDTPADRDAYIPHPAHKAFVAILLPHLDKATVVDYVARDR